MHPCSVLTACELWQIGNGQLFRREDAGRMCSRMSNVMDWQYLTRQYVRISINRSHCLNASESFGLWTLSLGLVPLVLIGLKLWISLRFRGWLRSKLPGCQGAVLSTAMLGSAFRFGTVRSLFCTRVPALIPLPRCAESGLTRLPCWIRLRWSKQNWEIVCNWDLGCKGVPRRTWSDGI